MGGQRKSVTSNNDERTNDERRTTNYIDDDNSPPGFFQNPRANNDGFESILNEKKTLSFREQVAMVSNTNTGYRREYKTRNRGE